MHRWPSSSGRDLRAMQFLVGDWLDQGVVAGDEATLRQVNADYDGDYIDLRLAGSDANALKNLKDKTIKEVLEQSRRLEEYQAAQALDEWRELFQIREGEKMNGIMEMKASEFEGLTDEEAQGREAFLQKYNKHTVGSFSNVFQALERGLYDAHMDASAITGATGDAKSKAIQNAVAAQTLLTLFEIPTQKGISAKKTSTLETLSYDPDWWKQLDNLLVTMKSQDILNSDATMRNALNIMSKNGLLADGSSPYGLLDKDQERIYVNMLSDMMSGKGGAQALATILNNYSHKTKDYTAGELIKGFKAGIDSPDKLKITEEFFLAAREHLAREMQGKRLSGNRVLSSFGDLFRYDTRSAVVPGLQTKFSLRDENGQLKTFTEVEKQELSKAGIRISQDGEHLETDLNILARYRFDHQSEKDLNDLKRAGEEFANTDIGAKKFNAMKSLNVGALVGGLSPTRIASKMIPYSRETVEIDNLLEMINNDKNRPLDAYLGLGKDNFERAKSTFLSLQGGNVTHAITQALIEAAREGITDESNNPFTSITKLRSYLEDNQDKDAKHQELYKRFNQNGSPTEEGGLGVFKLMDFYQKGLNWFVDGSKNRERAMNNAVARGQGLFGLLNGQAGNDPTA